MRSVKKASLAKQLMDEILLCIGSGELAAGEKIPSEAELAEQLNVSRNSLREALKSLETLGVIYSIHGQGTFVSPNANQRISNMEILQLLSDNDDLQCLLEARLVIEPGIARFAAERRTEEDIEALSASLDIFVNKESGIQNIFHIRLSEAAKSPVLHGYLQAIFQKLVYTPYPLLQEKLLADQHDEEVREHKELLDAIIDRDGDSAQNLMHMHLKRRFKLLKEMSE